MRRILCAALFILGSPVFAGGMLMPAAHIDWQEEWRPIQVCRDGMGKIVVYLHQGAFQAKDLLTSDQRQDLKNTWKSFLDYVDALDMQGNYLQEMARFADPKTQTKRLNGMVYGAFLTQYRSSLEFLAEMDKVPGADTLLNEAMPEWGLQKGSFAAFKLRFLNVAQAGKFAAQQTANLWENPGFDSKWEAQIKDDEKKLWAMGVGKGTALTAENGQKILTQGLFNAWFPTQKGVSQWMGATKVWRESKHLISQEQTQKLVKVLKPGDILFSRHEWYMSNLGLPGFWSHAALYIGTIKERMNYFDDPKVKEWVNGQGGKDGFERFLEANYPKAWEDSHVLYPSKETFRVIEAVSAGVVFSTMEKFASADSLSAIRPHLSKVEKARAILRAFGYAGRPYDFNFDFQSDDTLVCSELVYKAYEPAQGFKGMKFPIQVMAGHVVSSPNGMVEQFAEQYGTKAQQSDLVIFLDGHEKTGNAVEADLKTYRASWKRPKWNVLLQ